MRPDDPPDDAAAAADTGGTTGAPSPWATDVPVSAPPTFDWSHTSARAGAPSERTSDDVLAPREPGLGTSAGPIGFDGVDGVDEPAAAPGGLADLRRWWTSISTRSRAMLAVGVVVTTIVAAVLVVGARGSDDDADDAAAPTVTDAPTATDPDDDDPLPEPDTTDDTITDAEDDTGPDGDDGDGAGGDPGTEDDIPVGEWRSGATELPEALRTLRSGSTVVVLTSDRYLHEIDLPSGRVRSVRLGRTPSNAQLVTAGQATLLASWEGSTSWIVSAGREPIEVSLGGNRGPVLALPGRDEFVTMQFGNGPADFLEMRVAADGSTVTTPARADSNNPWDVAFAPWGDRLVTDAGGVYALGDDGARRISAGTLLGTSARHVLVRECDETYQCGEVLIEGATEERRPVDLGSAYSAFSLGAPAQVSPDGRFAWYVVYDDRGPTQVIVDLDTGEQQETTTSFVGEIGWVWTADSSGIVQLDGGGDLQYVDRESGQRTTFADDLGGGRIVAATVRSEAPDVDVPVVEPTTTGLRLAALTDDGVVHLVDVDTATSTVLVAGPADWFGNQRPNVIPTEDAVVFSSIDGVTAVRVTRDGLTATPLDGGTVPSRPLLPGPTIGTVWQPDSLLTDSAVFQLVDVTGAVAGGVMTTAVVPEADLLGSDGRGGLVVTSPAGGVYSVTPDGASRITTGGLVSLGPAAAYVQECDDTALCGVVRVDRATGERRPVSAALFDGVRVDDAGAAPTGSTVSPDGDVVITRSSPFGSGWALVDVAADASTEIPAIDAGTPIVWTADSRYAVWLSGGQITVYDRSIGGVRVLSSLPELRTFAPL